MATTKKTTPTKKLSRSKSSKNAPQPWSIRFSVVTIGIYAIVVATFILAAFSVAQFVSNTQNNDRLTRIQEVYKNVGIEESCINQAAARVNIFGDKRMYANDKSRTMSSSVSCARGDTVANTTKYYDNLIKEAGFTFIDEPYAGSVFKQLHYKNDDGVFVRLNVSSKPYDDAVFNEALMGGSKMTIPERFDTNAGPSNVTIKVNLDDNNE